MGNLTVWHSPFDSRSLDQLCTDVQALASKINATPNVLVPTHYGVQFQNAVHQNLDSTLLVDSISKLTSIRSTIEAYGVGFGAYGVPLDVDDAELAASIANAAGYYVANVEPDPINFWHPGDNAEAARKWVAVFESVLIISRFNTGTTLIPNTSHLSWSNDSLHAWYDRGLVLAEIYGGPQTPSYRYPNLWPWPSYAAIDQRFSWWTSEDTLLTVPIMALANVGSDYELFETLSDGNVHVWSM